MFKILSLRFSKTLVLVLFSFAFGLFSHSVNAQNKSKQTNWLKNNDSPGLAYKSTCLGKEKKTKFYKWQVEIFNDYENVIEMDVVLIDYLGHKVSESYRIKQLPGTVQKVFFYNSEVDCAVPSNVKISNITFKKDKPNHLPAHVIGTQRPNIFNN